MTELKNKIKTLKDKAKDILYHLPILNRWFIGAVVLCFILCFVFILMIFGRYTAITQIKNEISRLQTSLEHSSVDISYDNISFNIWWPMPIMTVENLKIYSRFEPIREWNIKELTVNTQFFDFHTLNISLSSKQNIVIGDNTYHINMPAQSMNVSYCVQTGIKELLLDIENLKVDGFADIKEIKFGMQRMALQPVSKSSPFLETHLLINDIKFAEELDMPLSQQIDKIYVNANMIGSIKVEETYRESIYDWLVSGGKFEIESSIFEWKPLIMVSKGDLYFNEKLAPRIHLSVSSKALIPSMDILEEEGVLDRKGVFVTRILLRNKAFKMSDSDEYDTVLTPVDYKDGILSVENIPVANF